MEAINTVGGVKKVPIAKGLALSVKNSRSNYEEALKDHR